MNCYKRYRDEIGNGSSGIGSGIESGPYAIELTELIISLIFIGKGKIANIVRLDLDAPFELDRSIWQTKC